MKSKFSGNKFVIFLILSIILFGLLLFLNKYFSINEYKGLHCNFKYGSDWNIISNDDELIVLEHKNKSLINIEIIQLEMEDKAFSIDNMLEGLVDDIKMNKLDYKFISKEKVKLTVNNCDGYKVLYEVDNGQVMILVGSYNDKAFIITYESDSNNFETLLDDVNKIVYNFNIINNEEENVVTNDDKNITSDLDDEGLSDEKENELDNETSIEEEKDESSSKEENNELNNESSSDETKDESSNETIDDKELNDTKKEPVNNNDNNNNNPNNNRNVIHFISTGNSDAILIESNGVYGLVDSSNPYNDGTEFAVTNKSQSIMHVIEYLNKLQIKYLDFIIATHSHSDHIGGMVELSKHFVSKETKYYYREYDGADDNDISWGNENHYKRSIAAMKSAGATLVEVTNKNPVVRYGEFELSLINTDKSVETKENYNSIGTILKCGEIKVFLSSDIEAADSNKIASKIGDVDIMKLNHHGGSGMTTEYFSVLQPEVAIITTKALHQNALAPVAYIKEKYNTVVYSTENVSDAIRVYVTSKDYKVESTSQPITLKTTKWVKWPDINKWIYLLNGEVHYGWLQKNEQWYYSGSTGFMLTGWHKLNWSQGRNWFYFDPTYGYMIANKCMVINNKNYCFDNNGVCYTDGCEVTD